MLNNIIQLNIFKKLPYIYVKKNFPNRTPPGVVVFDVIYINPDFGWKEIKIV